MCFVMYLSHLLYHIYDCCVITVFPWFLIIMHPGLFWTILDYSRSPPWDLTRHYPCQLSLLYSLLILIVNLLYEVKMFIGSQSLNLKQ